METPTELCESGSHSGDRTSPGGVGSVLRDDDNKRLRNLDPSQALTSGRLSAGGLKANTIKEFPTEDDM